MTWAALRLLPVHVEDDDDEREGEEEEEGEDAVVDVSGKCSSIGIPFGRLVL